MMFFGFISKHGEFFWSLLVSFLAGLYVAVFYITNNLSMLSRTSFIFLGLFLILLPIALTTTVFCVLKIAGKNHLMNAVSIALATLFIIILLRPALMEVDLINSFLVLVSDNLGSTMSNAVFTIFPAIIIIGIFKGDSQRFVIVLGVMIVAALITNSNVATSSLDNAGSDIWRKWHKYENIKLAEKPNVYLLVTDSYSSFNYMQDQGIDIEDFRQFLGQYGFRLYNEVFSNYYPTLNSITSMLNMEHHDYTVAITENPTEVKNSARLIIGGNNNFFHTLKNNGYTTQCIHQGTYLLLQGGEADYIYPITETYVGAKIILSKIFKYDLLTDEDKSWKNLGTEKIHNEVTTHISSDKSVPVVQYVHLWDPMHSFPLKPGHCDEQRQTEIYDQSVKKANTILERLIDDIVTSDSSAVIVLAGDHGPFILNNCSRFAPLKTVEQIRDRSGVLLAVRWPQGYDGRYDGKIKTSVNVLRYVLASLARNEMEVLKTTVADDVNVITETGNQNRGYFKIIENGKILDKAKPLQVRNPL